MYYCYEKPIYKKEQRWEMRYRLEDGTEKHCYPRSEEQRQKNLDYCKEHGIEVISCRKLYPFSIEKNAHNILLIHNKAYIKMRDMENDEVEWDENEYNRLEYIFDRTGHLLSYHEQLAWMPWEDYKDAKEYSALAVELRVNTCIEKGRYDLIQYC